MKPGLILTGIAGLAASSAAAAAPACPNAASAGAALRSARAELIAIPPTPMAVGVSAVASRRIEAVKDRIRTLVQSQMACAPPEPEALATALATAGGPAGDRHAIDYAVTRIRPDLLAVVATLGIECGADSMLMLYERRAGRWSEVMVRRSAPYRKVSGGWQELRFAVSPPDAGGGWFVATVSTTPWCSSSWRTIRYGLARRGPDAARPLLFLQGEAGDYMGDESEVTVKAERDAFELRNTAGSIDSGILIRRHVRRYAVRGDKAVRVQPVAENVRDFVDEWIDSPWAEAKGWSAGDSALAAAHARLQSARWKTLAGFASIRACKSGATQVEIAGNDAPGWFLLARGGAAGPWRLERAERRAISECDGPDRLGKN